jgi:hypothetical protein
MLDSEKIVGIDLVRVDGDTAVYGIYESADGGEEWMPLLESQKICDLLDYAKARYGNDTPMVMQQHIQEILLVQIIEDAKANPKNRKTTPVPPSSWLMRFLNFFRKRR